MATPARDSEFGHADLQVEAIQSIILATFGALIFVCTLIAIEPLRWLHEPIATIIGLTGTLLGARWLIRRSATASAVVLVLGLNATVAVSILLFGEGLLATLFSLVTLIGGVLLGWRIGVICTMASATVILLMARSAPGVLPPHVVHLALALLAGNLLVGWLLGRPTNVALAWAWSSWEQARDKAETARQRQAELARLSVQLEHACERLEVANAELERARKAAVEARRLKVEFATTISHELRTPLNLIIGFAETIVLPRRTAGAPRLPDEFRADVEAIYRNACHLSSLIDDVLELAQIEAHRLGFWREPCALHDIVDEAVAAVEMLIRDRSLTLEVDVPTMMPLLNVDRTRIRQVLINLFVNAARFTPAGGIRLTADVKGSDVVVSVADTGVGIPPDQLPAVFDEFRQVPGSDRLHHNGLGLPICKRLVELHGGTIGVESVVGQGTTFSFSLPTCENVIASLPDEWEARARPSHAVPPAILIVGDDEEAARLFRRFLDDYQVLTAASSEQALPLIEIADVRAVVAVGTHGETEAVRLRNRTDLVATVPMYTCSLTTMQTLGTALGAAAYLAKPVSREALQRALTGLGRTIKRVLVIDDDDEMVRLLGEMIRALVDDCAIECASKGATGLERMRACKPDVVLLDLLMPDVDGYEVLAAMQNDESLRDTSTIVISARGAQTHEVFVDSLTISRPEGLTVGELMAALRGSLTALESASPPAAAPTAGQRA